MKPSTRLRYLLAFAILALSSLAVAEDYDADPPSRVARLQFMEGQVSLQPGGVDEWAPANANRPLTTADRLWTDQGSRAELSIGSAALRMNSETALALTNLSDEFMQLELDQGSFNMSVRFLAPGESIEVDTPNFAYTVTAPGEYHFDVYPSQDRSEVTVRRGAGQVTGDGYPIDMRSGMHMEFRNGQSLNYRSLPMREDGFDRWSEARERRQIAAPSAQYVPAGTVGFEDLDDNGDWDSTPEYGNVWYPRVQRGWAPYRDGHWAWVEPWGWTWVDDAPWGFAPFHYGRWVNNRGRWGWCPGPATVRPVYAPALVAWIGNVSISVGGGPGVAWVPLGWHDPYFPGYHHSPVYARRLNEGGSRGINITIVNNYYERHEGRDRERFLADRVRYDHMRERDAIMFAPRDAFASGRSMRGVARPMGADAFGRGAVFGGRPSVVPSREAVFGGRTPMGRAPERLVMPSRIVAHTPPPDRPMNFDRQREVMQRNGGVPLSNRERNDLRGPAAAPGMRGQGNVAQPGGAGQPGGNRPAVVITGRGANAGPGHSDQPDFGRDGRQQQGGQPNANQPGGRGQQPVVQPGQQQGQQPVAQPGQGQQQQNRPNSGWGNDNRNQQPNANQPGGRGQQQGQQQPVVQPQQQPNANQPGGRGQQPTQQPPVNQNNVVRPSAQPEVTRPAAQPTQQPTTQQPDGNRGGFNRGSEANRPGSQQPANNNMTPGRELSPRGSQTGREVAAPQSNQPARELQQDSPRTQPGREFQNQGRPATQPAPQQQPQQQQREMQRPAAVQQPAQQPAARPQQAAPPSRPEAKPEVKQENKPANKPENKPEKKDNKQDFREGRER